MDEDYKCIKKKNYGLEIPNRQEEIDKFIVENLEVHHLKSLISVKEAKKY